MTIFEKFYAHLYEKVPNPATSYIGWGNIRPDGNDPMVYFSVEELLSGVVEVYPDKRNMYFSVAPLSARRNLKENVLGSSVAWVDYDGYKDKNGETVLTPPASLIPYSFAVASGGPGGYHLYWLLNQWVSPSEIEALNKVMLKHLGNNDKTDKCWNMNRVLRIPGTINYKAERGETSSELVIDQHGYRYDYADLMKLGQVADDVYDIPTDKDGNALSRSERDWRIVMTAKKWGVSDGLARLTLLHHSDKAQESPGHYVEQTLTKVNEAVALDKGDVGKSVKSVLDDAPMNFNLVPVGMLITPDGERVGVTLRIEWDGGTKIRAAKQQDFNSKSTLLKWLRGIDGGLVWWGSDAKVPQMYGELIASAPATTQLEVEQAGRYDLQDGSRVFIYGNDRVMTWPQQEEMVNVTWEPKIGVQVGLRLGESGAGIPLDEMRMVYETLLKVQPASVLFPAMGWMVATLFKSVVEEFDGRLPILMLYGVRGSGKTSLIREALLRMVGLFVSPISADITQFALYGNLSATRSWPVWIGEFRNNNRNAEQLQQTLRSSYDVGQVERGTADMTVTQYKLTAPLIVDGETAFTDSANTDRAVSLLLDHGVVVTANYVDAFERLRTWGNEDWAQMARRLVEWSLTKDQEYVQTAYEQGIKRFEGLGFTSRVTNNIAVCWMGWYILADYLGDLGIGLDLSTEPFVSALHNTHKPGIGNLTQADYYISEVTHQAAANPVGMGAEFDGDVLWVSLTRARMHARTLLPIGMLETQLSARRDAYVVGKRVDRGGIMWGIDLRKAQAMGLDVAMPDTSPTYTVDATGDVTIKL
jgi:hypothetical protein